jgi:hypothetical protein
MTVPTSTIPPTRRHITGLALTSARHFAELSRTHTLHLRRARLDSLYDLGSHGRFAIFRETVSEAVGDDPPVVLVVGFRLRVIGSSPAAHWLFERCCILTTPFWSGLPGFRVKLWMVDPVTKDYLGIYDWAGREPAQAYVDALVRVLKALSVRGSVWYELGDGDFEGYLAEHRADAA